MKLITFVFSIIFVLQVSVTNARTVEEIQIDFEHVFQNLHHSLKNLEKFLATEGNNKLKELKTIIPQEQLRVQSYVASIEDFATNNVRKILNDAGVSDYPDLVQQCINTESTAITNIGQQLIGGAHLCAAYAYRKLETINNTIISMQYELYNMHLEVEYTRNECAPMTHPLDMQSCLIENLYEKNKPEVEDFEEQVMNMYKTIHVDVHTGLSELNECSDLAMIAIGADSASVIKEFKNCIEDIVN